MLNHAGDGISCLAILDKWVSVVGAENTVHWTKYQIKSVISKRIMLINSSQNWHLCNYPANR